jgi:hypothetical protein
MTEFDIIGFLTVLIRNLIIILANNRNFCIFEQRQELS